MRTYIFKARKNQYFTILVEFFGFVDLSKVLHTILNTEVK